MGAQSPLAPFADTTMDYPGSSNTNSGSASVHLARRGEAAPCLKAGSAYASNVASIEAPVVSFPGGEDGGHQILNRTGKTVRFVAISTSGEPAER
jgi:hypothetical protein